MNAVQIESPLTNRFSWQRVWMCWEYYRPQLQLQLWLWPLITVGLFVAAILLSLVHLDGVAASLISLSSMLITFAPLMLLRSKAMVVDTLLPVKVSERVMFLILYFLIVIPVEINLVANIMVQVSEWVIGPKRTYDICLTGWVMIFKNLSALDIFRYFMMQYGSLIMEIMGALVGVVACKRHRAIKAIVLSVGSGFVLGMISGFVGMAVVLSNMSIDEVNTYTMAVEAAENSPIDLVAAMWSNKFLATILSVVLISSWIITFVEIWWMTWRLKRRQF